MRVRIYYHHTDCGGVVYYANYLKFLEEARTELLEEKGISVKELTRQGVLFVVSRQEVDYKSPAVYGDNLQIKAKLTDISKVKLEFEYEVINQDGRAIILAKTVLACVDTDLRPRAIPEEMRRKLLQQQRSIKIDR